MKRVLEQEIMNNFESICAFADADFSKLYQMIIDKIEECFGEQQFYNILDLGCGPGALSCKLLSVYEDAVLYGIDGSENMLKQAKHNIERAGVSNRVNLYLDVLPGTVLPNINYDLIHASNLLHHLSDPNVLWETIKLYGEKGTRVFVMDPIRPESEDIARDIVNRVSKEENEIMKSDHLNSLLASFTFDEVLGQLKKNKLDSTLHITKLKSHIIISGCL